MSNLSVTLELHKVGDKAYWRLVYRERYLDDEGRSRERVVKRKQLGQCWNRRRKGYVSKRTAETELQAERMKIRRRPLGAMGGPTLGDWLQTYRKQREREGKAAATLKVDQMAERLLLAAFPAEFRVGEFRKADARDFLGQLQSGELDHVSQSTTKTKRPSSSPASVRKYLVAASAVFQRAVDDEVIEANPFRRLGRPSPSRAEWRYVSVEEFGRLLAVVPARWQRLVALARLAALSRDDAITLTWGSVDLERGEIRRKRGKTNADQHVPIGPRLAELMTQWREERGSLPLPGARVIKSPPRVDNIGRSWRGYVKKAGIYWYGSPLHTLRKSCIRDWARIPGVSASAVQRWAGHRSIKTTLDYYDQPGEDDIAKARAAGAPPNAPPSEGAEEAAGAG